MPAESPAEIVDLGCGTGAVTALLKERWPDARIVGVDSSADMLDKARQDHPDVVWQQADVAQWSPDVRPDLILSNSVLHWLDDHGRMFPNLVGMLGKGGVLAVQMPRNFEAPSHTCIMRAVESGPWKDRLAPLTRPNPVAPPPFYHGLLSPLAQSVDVWEVEYYQVLRGDSPVVEWTSGTILRPLLAALTDTERPEFLEAYGRCVETAYPAQPDGTTLFPFRRIFIVACT